jgi:hypothetical protein
MTGNIFLFQVFFLLWYHHSPHKNVSKYGQKIKKNSSILFIQTWCINTNFVTILTLGSQPRQGLAKVRAKKEARESHFILLGMQKSVREWTLTLSRELPLWEFKFSGSDCKGQNSLDWGVHYIIEKLLELTCLRWARMTHLDIWNISYGQKKGRESNWQFDSRPLKVRNPEIQKFIT